MNDRDHRGHDAVRTILHVDMDAFFASVEVLDDDSLAGRPVVVGGTGGRGVVASASYEARAHGVGAAMPINMALARCPHAAVVAPRHHRYAEVSERVMELCQAVTPLVEPLSLDEAFLDVSGALRATNAQALARELRTRIAHDVGLACSVGIGPSKLIAKLATEDAKPTASPAGPVPGLGVVEIAQSDVPRFLYPKPVQALWGVGPATLSRLRRLGVITIGDLADVPLASLRAALGEPGVHLASLAKGDDPRDVVVDRRAKSIGQEETFAADRFGLHELSAVLHAQCEAVAERLRRSGVGARTVSVKVRFADFRTVTRSVTLDAPSDLGRELGVAAAELLASVPLDDGVRLLGVSTSGLVTGAPRQLRLDEAQGSSYAAIEEVVREIRGRLGHDAIARGRRSPRGR